MEREVEITNSPKYAAWAQYRTPAKGFGIHAWMLEHNAPIRLTQAELEAHPAERIIAHAIPEFCPSHPAPIS